MPLKVISMLRIVWGLLRIILGFALSPLASGVLGVAIKGSPMAFGIVIFAYPFALTLGIPAFIVARYLGWLSLPAVIAGGAGLSVLAGLLIALDGSGFGGYAAWSVILGLLLFAAHGAVVAGLFWLIALWRRHEDRRLCKGE